MADWQVIEGDCVEQMRAIAEASVDAVVCDPPYHLAFMGRTWDHAPTPAESQAMHLRWALEAKRVLKPGGHLLAFGGTRTYHRLACAIEDAGFEIRDTIAWMYGSGFPKSLNVSKAIDNAAGAEREVVGERRVAVDKWTEAGRQAHANGDAAYAVPVTAPATPDAARWQGWGTALKPAHEPIVVARKPLGGAVAASVLEWGTGALNVDGCRIGTDPGYSYPNGPRGNTGAGAAFDGKGMGRREEPVESNPLGRWPANVILDPDAAAVLDEQTGPLPGGTPRKAEHGATGSGVTFVAGHEHEGFGDQGGGASRFFYVAKASSAERNAGLDGFEAVAVRTYEGGEIVSADHPGTGNGGRATRQNVHPTVKPIDLMRWLCRLVCPPGGIVLDPFVGSGTTGCAAALEGFRFVGIEREAEYAAIARARIAWWSQHPDGVEIVKALEAERERSKVRESGQIGLFDLPAEGSAIERGWASTTRGSVTSAPPQEPSNGRKGEASAEARYTDRGSSNFAMRPGRRRSD